MGCNLLFLVVPYWIKHPWEFDKARNCNSVIRSKCPKHIANPDSRSLPWNIKSVMFYQNKLRCATYHHLIMKAVISNVAHHDHVKLEKTNIIYFVKSVNSHLFRFHKDLIGYRCYGSYTHPIFQETETWKDENRKNIIESIHNIQFFVDQIIGLSSKDCTGTIDVRKVQVSKVWARCHLCCGVEVLATKLRVIMLESKI